jgi:L-threonylcarbamoyladenylate synthase
VESTVICFRNDKIHILRPGGVTAEMLSEFAEVEIDRAVTAQPEKGERVLSPGMKYKHYSPKANVIIVNAHGESFRRYCEENADGKTIALGAGVQNEGIFLDYGATSDIQAKRLFAMLREADELGADTVFVEMPSENGIGLAVYNRLLRAAGFEIVEVDK